MRYPMPPDEYVLDLQACLASAKASARRAQIRADVAAQAATDAELLYASATLAVDELEKDLYRALKK